MTADVLPFLAAAVLVVAAGVLSAVDAALAQFSRARAQELVAEGRTGATRLLALLDDPPRYLSTALLLRLPPAAFVPPPKVWSAVVGLQPLPTQPEPELFAAMERLMAAAFGQLRKMLRGSLRSLGGEALLDRAGISGERRAETLDVAEFDRLARLI